MNPSGAAKPATRYCVSAEWEQLLQPLPVIPGADMGVTMPEYLWLLKQCRAKTDWQLHQWHLTFSGRLMCRPQRTLQWRPEPPEGWLHCFWDGKDDKESTFRTRKKPLRQEPEWQFDDLDVAAAWKRFDASLLDRFAPAEVLSVGVKAIACLGHWPRRSISDVGNPNARREILLAKLLDAAIARPLSSYAYADFFEAIRCRTQLAALRSGSSSIHNAAKLVDENNAVKLVDDSSAGVILKDVAVFGSGAPTRVG